MRWGFESSFVVASVARRSRSFAAAGHCKHSSAAAPQAAPRRSGTDAMTALGTTALGWPLSTHPPHARACHAKSHPTGVPCQSTLPNPRTGKFSPDTARSAPSQFSPVPLLCPPSLSTAPLRPRSLFPFLFLPLPPLAPRVSLCLFFSLRPCCLRFRKSILSRAFCRRSIALAVGPCLQSSSTTSTTSLPRHDSLDPRASSTPPDENTGRACCLLFLRVSFVVSPLALDSQCLPCLWYPAWKIESCKYSTRTWILDVDLDLALDLDSKSDLGGM